MKTLLDRCVKELASEIERFPWEERRLYADWLAQTYYYVRHSTRLLAAAAARFPFDARGDALHRRFGAHMAEEKQHEKLCEHDLKALGIPLAEMRERVSTRMFYEPQYYKIEHQHPLALFGYILPLEALGPACGQRQIDRVTGAHGPKSAAFIKVHASDDVEHLEKALALVADVPEREREFIAQNLEQSTHAYLGILHEIGEVAGERH